MAAVGHKHIDHTADLAFEVWAPTEEALLLEAAQALIGVMTDHSTISHRAEHHVQLDGLDAPDRLVRWLNEVLVLGVTRGFLLCNADITLKGNAIEATMMGETGATRKIVSELKSVTYHDLALGQTDAGWRCQFVVDV